MTTKRYMKSLCCWVTVLGVLACLSAAATIYVDQANTDGPWDGTSWASAWTNITDGLDHLATTNTVFQGGHTVKVAAGTYAGMHDLTGAHAATNEAARNVLLGVGEVIVDAAGASYGFYLNGPTYFTLRNLRITGAGEGLRLADAPSDEHYTIQDCEIYGNTEAVDWKTHFVDDVVFTNTAFYLNVKGITLGSAYKRWVIANCTFIHNDEYAILCRYGSADVTMRNCVIAGNGGIGADEGKNVIRTVNCLFYKNGGGNFNDGSAGVLNSAAEINAVSDCTNNLVATPGFVDLYANNLRLVYNDSPCLGNGTDGSNIGLNNLLTTPSSAGYTYYVATTGGDGYTVEQARNPLTPWQTIQHAADNLLAGDTVQVAAGTYAETVTITKTGSVGKPVRFLAEEGVIVDGGLDGIDLQHAVDVTVDGFKVISCSRKGIGLNASFGCTIMNCVVDAGASYGIYLREQNGLNLITDCEMTNNDYGLYVYDSGQLIVNCDIHDNNTGLYAGWCSSELQNCNIYNNSTRGCYHFTMGALRYDNCNIVNNGAEGFWLRYNGAHAALYNCNIVGCETYGINEGGAGNLDAELYHCNLYDCPSGLLYDGDTAIAYTNAVDINTLAGPVEWYTNNISVDPLFENALAGDFRLSRDSPCIDMGTLTTALTSDYFGNPRLLGAAVDIGVHEVAPPPGTIITVR